MTSELNLEDMRTMACDNELVKYPFSSGIVGSYSWEEKPGNKDLYQKELQLENGMRVLFRVLFESNSLTTKFVDCQEA